MTPACQSSAPAKKIRPYWEQERHALGDERKLATPQGQIGMDACAADISSLTARPLRILVPPRGEGAPGGAPILPQTPRDGCVCFERIYDQYFDHVARWVLAHGARRSDVDDLVQEVFIVAHRRLPHFDGDNVAGWLYRITGRKVRDHRRLAWTTHFFSGRALGSFDRALSTAVTPLRELEAKEEVALLERALDTLTAAQRAAFVLFELEGYTGEEIARIQNTGINTTWGRIHKARHKLQSRVFRDQRAD
jgi:RNA polymerase sigma-70 factor, ECF subfamily